MPFLQFVFFFTQKCADIGIKKYIIKAGKNVPLDLSPKSKYLTLKNSVNPKKSTKKYPE